MKRLHWNKNARTARFCPCLEKSGKVIALDSQSYSTAYHTLIWETTESAQKGCEVERMPRRSRQLHKNSGILVLIHNGLQLDFVLGQVRSTYDAMLPKVFSIVGEKQLSLFLLDSSAKKLFPIDYQYGNATSQEVYEGNGRSTKLRVVREMLTIRVPQQKVGVPSIAGANLAEVLPQHLQWIRDGLMDHENLLVAAVNKITCKFDQLRVFELLALSKFSGVQAARAWTKMQPSRESNYRVLLVNFKPEADF